MGETFDTRESLLALCLILAGAEPAEETQPAFNLFDEEILFKIGGGMKDERTGEITRPSRFSGMTLEAAANQAWQEKARGDVGHILKMSPRLSALSQAYHDQCKQIEKLDGNAQSLIVKIIAQHELGGILQDEMILRIACVILKTRGSFMNVWKEMVPILRVPDKGKTKNLSSREGEHVRQKPGFRVVSLNISDEHKKGMGL